MFHIVLTLCFLSQVLTSQSLFERAFFQKGQPGLLLVAGSTSAQAHVDPMAYAGWKAVLVDRQRVLLMSSRWTEPSVSKQLSSFPPISQDLGRVCESMLIFGVKMLKIVKEGKSLQFDEKGRWVDLCNAETILSSDPIASSQLLLRKDYSSLKLSTFKTLFVRKQREQILQSVNYKSWQADRVGNSILQMTEAVPKKIIVTTLEQYVSMPDLLQQIGRTQSPTNIIINKPNESFLRMGNGFYKAETEGDRLAKIKAVSPVNMSQYTIFVENPNILEDVRRKRPYCDDIKVVDSVVVNIRGAKPIPPKQQQNNTNKQSSVNLTTDPPKDKLNNTENHQTVNLTTGKDREHLSKEIESEGVKTIPKEEKGIVQSRENKEEKQASTIEKGEDKSKIDTEGKQAKQVEKEVVVQAEEKKGNASSNSSPGKQSLSRTSAIVSSNTLWLIILFLAVFVVALLALVCCLLRERKKQKRLKYKVPDHQLQEVDSEFVISSQERVHQKRVENESNSTQ